MRNIKLILEYDGTNFLGWQIQPNGRTVQREIEQSLKQLFQEDIRVHSAGRTDAGVHALGQVVNFRVEKQIPLFSIQRALNSLLPEEIRVLAVEETTTDFDARYSAVKRHYRYLISLVPTAINRLYCWYVAQPLDLNLMNECAQLIIGEHDFKSFCQAGAKVKNYQCKVEKAGWYAEGKRLIFDIVANRFLHNMVRILVGTMVEVGTTRLTVAEFAKILANRDRTQAGPTAPARGLFLVQVFYNNT